MVATKPKRATPPPPDQPTPDYQRVREVVLNWPPEAQAQLVHEVINRFVPMRNGREHIPDVDAVPSPLGGKRNTLSLIGMLNYDGPELSDADLERMLAEARAEKYAPELLSISEDEA